MAVISNIVTTVLGAAGSYNLTVLNTAKDELSLSSNDTANDVWLTRAIGQISKSMMNATNRVFVPEYLQDSIDIERSRSQVPGGIWEVMLSRFPILSVVSVAQTSSELNTTVTLIEGVDFAVDYESGKLLRLDASTGLKSAWEALPLVVRYIAGYGDAAKETQSVPTTPVYQVVVSQGASYSCNQSVTYANGSALTLVTANPAHGQYTLDPATGTYVFAAADAGQSLTFAYATKDVPADIEEVCLRLVAGRFRSKDRDPMLIQQDTPHVGMQRWWFGGTPGQSGAFPPEIEAILDSYRVPVVA